MRKNSIFVTRVLPVVVSLAVCSVASGDDTHYQDYVVGGRAVGLAGAFGSIADDPSGLFYNPAGIADSRYSSLQVSTSLYGFERGSYEVDLLTLPIPGVDQLDIQFSDLVVVPASAGAVKTFGRKGADGNPTEAYAFSLNVPSLRSFAVIAPYSKGGEILDPAYRNTEFFYSRRGTDRSLWTGFGYARRFDNGLRLGVSLQYIFRSVVDVEEVFSSATLDAELSGDADPAEVFNFVTNDVSVVNGSLVLLAGLKYRHRHFTFGLTLQSPSLQIHSIAKLRFIRGESVPTVDCSDLSGASEACGPEGVIGSGGGSQFWSFQPSSIDSETKYAPLIRGAASFALPYKLTFSADLIYHFPVRYSLLKITEEGSRWLPFNPNIKRRQVLNFSVGAEFLIIREVSLSGGVFSDFSSADKLSELEYDSDESPYVNIMGTVFALGYYSNHALTRLGLLYSAGKGHDVIPTNGFERALYGSKGFQRVDYFQSFFYVFLSSTYRY